MAEDQDRSQQTEEPPKNGSNRRAKPATSSNPPEVSAFVRAGRRHARHRHVRPFHRGRDRQAHAHSSSSSPSRCRWTARAWRRFSAACSPPGIDAGALHGRYDRGRARRSCAAEQAELHRRKAQTRFFQVFLSAGLTRMFGLEGWMNLLKGLIKIAIVGMAVWTQLWPERGHLEAMLAQSPERRGRRYEPSSVQGADRGALGAAGDRGRLIISSNTPASCSATACPSRKIKEEYRQNEGDPAIKAKVRQIRQERARKRMMAAVPEATVVITNPTHFAVALQIRVRQDGSARSASPRAWTRWPSHPRSGRGQRRAGDRKSAFGARASCQRRSGRSRAARTL